MCEPIETDEFGYATTAAVIGEEFKGAKRDRTAEFTSAADANGGRGDGVEFEGLRAPRGEG